MNLCYALFYSLFTVQSSTVFPKTVQWRDEFLVQQIQNIFRKKIVNTNLIYSQMTQHHKNAWVQRR